MQQYQRDFFDFAIRSKVLRFGEFTLKSGRLSPYFFNSGLFNDGAAIAELGRYYAAAIQASNLDFDMLYGPAYKGIPLAIATVIALNDQHQRNIPYAFNRKEAKDHGEGGVIVGAPLQGRVLVIDDVISAGTSVRESADIITQADAELAGVAIALNRQERGQGETSAIQEVERDYGIQVVSIADLESLKVYLSEKTDMSDSLARITEYQQQYGT
jgi:orotate phosphoribosyltransferase